MSWGSSFRAAALGAALILASLPVAARASEGDVVLQVKVESSDPQLQQQGQIFFARLVDRAISPREVSDAIKEFYQRHPIYRLKALREPVDGGWVLHLVVVPQSTVEAIDIKGNHNLESGDLSSHLGVSVQDRLVPEQLGRAQASLEEYYTLRGFPKTTVKAEAVRRPEPNEVRVRVRINEGEPCRIEELSFDVDWALVSEKKVRKALAVKTGDRCDLKKIEAGTRRIEEELRKSGRLAATVERPQVAYSEDGMRARIALKIVQGPRVKVGFLGNTFAWERDNLLRDAVGYRDERQFNRSWIDATAVEGIREFYRGHGYPNAVVQVDERTFEKEDLRRIRFTIDRGRKVRIRELRFQGMTVFPEKRVRKEFLRGAAEHTRANTYVESELEESSAGLVAFYQSHGYLRTTVAPPKLEFSKDLRGVTATFDVDEGPLTTLEEFRFPGNTHFEEKKLAELFKLKPGDPIQPTALVEAGERLKGRYRADGYKFATVKLPDVGALPAGGAVYEVTIDEGPVVTFRDVFVEGNLHTKEYVIRRELEVKKGDRYDPAALRESRRSLMKLGFFESVSLEEVNYNPLTAEQDLVVVVRERKKRSVKFRPGFSTDEGARAAVELGYMNIGGTGRRAAAEGRVNRRIQDFQIWEHREVLTYQEPYLIGPSNGRIHFINERTEEETFDIDRTSVILGLDTPVTTWLNNALQYELEFRSPFNVQEGAILNPIDEESARFGSLATIFTLDRRNDLLNPLKGSFHRVDFHLYSDVLASEADFWQTELRNTFYQPIYKRIRAVLAVRLGFAATFGSTSSDGTAEIPIEKRFRLGGNNTLRGFGRNCVGGVDSDVPENCQDEGSEQAPGGNSMFNYMLDLLLPLYGGMDLALFTDGGNAFKLNEDFNPIDIRTTAGVGLRYNTFFGPLRLDFGFKLDRREGEGLWEIHFAVGQL